MLTNFHLFIEYKKLQATIYNDPQSVLTITAEDIRSSLTPKWFLKTQFFEKKATSQVKKSFCPIFSRIIECDKSQAMNCNGPKSIQTITVEVKTSFL